MPVDIYSERKDETTCFKVEVQSDEPHFYGYFEIDVFENYEKGSENNSDSYDRHVDWTTFFIPEQIFYEGEKELFEKWVMSHKEEIEDKIR